MPAAKKSSDTQSGIIVQRIKRSHILVPIVGVTPLIVNRFGAKARQQLLDQYQGKRAQRKAKDPEAEYLETLYRMKGDRYGFPAVGFKSATIAAARLYRNVTMTGLRQLLTFVGEISDLDPQALVEIKGDHRMRQDITRVGGGAPDLRYRAEFPEWSAELEIFYVESMIDRDSVLSLVDAGGLTVGVGEWRPEKGRIAGGDFGTYAIDSTRDVIELPGGVPVLSRPAARKTRKPVGRGGARRITE